VTVAPLARDHLGEGTAEDVAVRAWGHVGGQVAHGSPAAPAAAAPLSKRHTSVALCNATRVWLKDSWREVVPCAPGEVFLRDVHERP
jgi:hypothetical protein